MYVTYYLIPKVLTYVCTFLTSYLTFLYMLVSQVGCKILNDMEPRIPKERTLTYRIWILILWVTSKQEISMNLILLIHKMGLWYYPDKFVNSSDYVCLTSYLTDVYYQYRPIPFLCLIHILFYFYFSLGLSQYWKSVKIN